MKWTEPFIIKPPSGGSEVQPGFSVTLDCKLIVTVKAGGRRRPASALYDDEDDDTKRTFTANRAVDIPGNEEEVRDVLRGMLRSLAPLQLFRLTNQQWEEIIPESAVPLLLDLACQAGHDGCIAAATIKLTIQQYFEFSACSALLALCEEAER